MSTVLKLDKQKLYTYADLLTWPENERWELIDGVPYLNGVAYGDPDSPHAMASPNRKHQAILVNLIWKFKEHLKDKVCEVYVVPFDVWLFANADKRDDDNDKTVVQPDLLIVCDLNKLEDGKGVKGAPDLVVEILSPSNSHHDTTIKFKKYREAAVPEIWFIDPDYSNIQVFRIKGGKYSVDFYNAEDIVPVGILPGFEINMNDIF